MSILHLSVVMLLSLNLNGIESDTKISNHLQPNDDAEFDCVDIYKQPAFNHPLLKNHKIQMSPSFMPKFERSHESSFEAGFSIMNQIKGCPDGMVPIERTRVTANKLSELRAFAKQHLGSESSIGPLTKENPNKHFAVANAYTDDSQCGTKAMMSANNPAVKMNQVSMAQMWIENGEGADLSSLQVGWAVHPLLYRDNKTHLTAYWTADGSQKTGCYNAMCPGFVHVHPTARLGSYLNPISVVGGAQFVITPTVFKDKTTGNYWLVINDEIKMGYWPREILNKLNLRIGSLRYGGWTSSSPDGVSPPMGSGIMPVRDYRRTAFFLQIEYMECDGSFFDVFLNHFYVDNSTCYGLGYWGYHKRYFGETFAYGGPGGVCGI